MHPKITAALDTLRGKQFAIGDLLAALRAQGFNELQAGFAARECWATKAVIWRKNIGRVAV